MFRSVSHFSAYFPCSLKEEKTRLEEDLKQHKLLCDELERQHRELMEKKETGDLPSSSPPDSEKIVATKFILDFEKIPYLNVKINC